MTRLEELYALRAKVEAEIVTEMRREAGVMVGRKPRRTRKDPVASCGTDAGYYRHRRRLNEDACGACKKAHNKAEANRRMMRRWEAEVA